MKGITPVIAIILLLLMAVAAAGGFYFVYQNFQEEGASTGTTQMESLTDTAGKLVKVESVAGGKVYLRNVGTGSIDPSKIAVYVDEVPVEFTTDCASMGAMEMCTLELTDTPSCSGSDCQIRIGGVSSARYTAEPEDLEVEASCGDGTCGSGETASSCWQDCKPESVLLFTISEGDMFWREFEATSSGYSAGDIITSITDPDEFPIVPTAFDQNTPVVACYNIDSSNIAYSAYSSSSWSSPVSFTESPDYDFFGWSAIDKFGDQEIVVWQGGDWSSGGTSGGGGRAVYWAEFENGVLQSQNAMSTAWVGSTNPKAPAFAFTEEDSGFLFFTVNFATSDYPEINYRERSDGSWGSSTNLFTGSDAVSDDIFYSPSVAFNSSSEGVVVFGRSLDGYYTLYSFYDGSSWTEPQAFTEISDPIAMHKVLYDAEGDPMILRSVDESGILGRLEYSVWDGSSWSSFQDTTSSIEVSPVMLVPPMRLEDGTIVVFFMDNEDWEGSMTTTWYSQYWDGSSWSTPSEVG